MSRSKADAGAARGRPPRNPAAGLALRGGGARGDAAHDSDDDDPADVSLTSAARSQLQLVMRTFNTSSEVIEANHAMRELPAAFARGGAAAATAVRMAPAIFGRLLQAASMSQEQLRVLCQRFGFHPAVSGALYYSLQATSGSAAVFALGLAIFSLQAMLGGVALLLSVLGAFGSTLLLGGAAGTAVIGGSVVVPSFILSSGTAVLVFVAGVVTREGGGRRARRAGHHRAPRELPPRIYEITSPDDNLGAQEREHRESGRDAGDDARSRQRRTSSREQRERPSGVRASREGGRDERREATGHRNSSNGRDAARAAAAAAAPAPHSGSPAAASGSVTFAEDDAPRGAAQRAAAARPEKVEDRRRRIESERPESRSGPDASAAAREDGDHVGMPDAKAAAEEATAEATAEARAEEAAASPAPQLQQLTTAEPEPVRLAPARAPARAPAAQRSAPPPLCSQPPATEPATPPLPQRPPPPATPPQPPPTAPAPQATDGTSEEGSAAGAHGETDEATSARQGGLGAPTARSLAVRNLESSLSQQSRDALKSGKAFLL